MIIFLYHWSNLLVIRLHLLWWLNIHCNQKWIRWYRKTLNFVYKIDGVVNVWWDFPHEWLEMMIESMTVNRAFQWSSWFVFFMYFVVCHFVKWKISKFLDSCIWIRRPFVFKGISFFYCIYSIKMYFIIFLLSGYWLASSNCPLLLYLVIRTPINPSPT